LYRSTPAATLIETHIWCMSRQNAPMLFGIVHIEYYICTNLFTMQFSSRAWFQDVLILGECFNDYVDKLLTIRTNTLSMSKVLSCHVTANVKLTRPKGTIVLQRIVLRSGYGIHANTRLISHDLAFLLASISLTSDFIRRVRISTNLALVLSSFPFHGYECNWH